jgi:formylglycine-generating enzyme required for sulfatase activity
MADSFDPYHRWLGIPRHQQPANHYRLLGLELFESDVEVIRDAAEQRMAHVHAYQLGPHSALSQKILNELALAKACLLDAARRSEYDGRLRAAMPPRAAEARPAPIASHPADVGAAAAVEAAAGGLDTRPSWFNAWVVKGAAWLSILLPGLVAGVAVLVWALSRPSVEPSEPPMSADQPAASEATAPSAPPAPPLDRAVPVPHHQKDREPAQADQPAGPSLVLAPIPKVRLEAGGSCHVEVKVERGRCQGPVVVSFEGLPQHVSVKESTIPAERDSARFQFLAAASAEEQRKEVRAVAVLVGLSARRQFQLAVSRPRPVEHPAVVNREGQRKAKESQEAWARRLGVPALLVNSIGLKLVLIPPGEFTMGAHDGDATAASSAKPQHRVRITRPFFLGMYEVTQGEYEKMMGANPSDFEDSGGFAPVENASWNDAQAFCERLSGLPEEQAAGRRYRLPTEAEWEYACRAGSILRCCFGEEVGELGQYAWYDGNSAFKTHPVGQKKPNAWGLHDMYGNVWEWCADRYDERYYQVSPADDPAGPSVGSSRVLRGGSWDFGPAACSSTCRGLGAPGDRSRCHGFRVACVQQTVSKQ